jgi:hypothetical protein
MIKYNQHPVSFYSPPLERLMPCAAKGGGGRAKLYIHVAVSQERLLARIKAESVPRNL